MNATARISTRRWCLVAAMALVGWMASSPHHTGVCWAEPNIDDDELFDMDDDDDDDDDDDGDGDDDDDSRTVELGPAPAGAGENPDAVSEFGVEKKAKPVGIRRIGYPVEIVHRPLTLLEGMFEFGLTLPSYADPLQTQTGVSVSYGVTSQVQLGLAYGPGTANGNDGFTVGKAFHIEGRYLVTDWMSVQATLPMYADPFAIGLTLGAPMRFRLTDRAAIVFGQDLLSINVYRFAPRIVDALYNEDRVNDDNTGTTIDRGDLRLVGGIIYQIKPNVALMGETGIVAFDYALTDSGVPLRATLTWSPNNSFDLLGRLGFDNLDEPNKTFGLTVSAALRL